MLLRSLLKKNPTVL